MRARPFAVPCMALLCACASQPPPKPAPPVNDLEPYQAVRTITTAIGAVRKDYIAETNSDHLTDLAIAGLLHRAGIHENPDDIHSLITRPLAPWELKNPADSRRARRLVTAYGLAKKKRPDISNEVLAKAAVDNVLTGLEGNNSLLTRTQWQELRHGDRTAGIGVVLRKAGRRISILYPLPQSPALQAGLKRGDTIAAIDGHPVANETLADVVTALRGKTGSTVNMTVLSADGKQHTVRLTRAFVRYVPFEVRWYAHNVVYIHINAVARYTARAIRKDSVDWLRRPGGLKGLILDLRGNPGGLLSESARVADLFLRDGLIAKVEARDPRFRVTYRASDNHSPLESVPMVVLVNHGTASGAELIAAALQSHHRARVVGYNTFGMGTVQTLILLPSGMTLRLTTASLLTPRLAPLQGKGITPDICLASGHSGGCRQNDTAPDALEPYMTKALQLLYASTPREPTRRDGAANQIE